jgi:hypothetical protein
MITYQLEKFVDVYPEVLGLLALHWEEVALNKDIIKLEPDVEMYKQHERDGALHLLTVRENGVIIGYHCSIVKPHLHYASSLTAFVDVYFVDPKKRDMPRVAMRMFKEAEKTLAQRGVQRISASTKIHLDKSSLLVHLGFSEAERVFIKVIQGG